MSAAGHERRLYRRYATFGIVLGSELPLHAEYDDRDAPLDAEILLSLEPAPSSNAFELGTRQSAIAIDGRGALRVSDGRRIDVYGEPGVDDVTLGVFAMGPGLAMLFEQRGAFVLHGSCVSIDGLAISIVGPAGAGKSTLALALHRRGHPLISDGMTVLNLGSGRPPMAEPGPRHLKLWAESAAFFGANPETLARVLPSSDKRILAIDWQATVPVPLAHVVVTEPGDRPKLERVALGAALMALMQNAYIVDYVDDTSAPALLERAAPVAESVSVSKLCRGSSLDALDSAADLVEALVRSPLLSRAQS